MANRIVGAISKTWRRVGLLASGVAGVLIARWWRLRLRIPRLARQPKQPAKLALGSVWIDSQPPDLTVDQKVELWFCHRHADYMAWLERYGRKHWFLSADHPPDYVEDYSSGSYFEVGLVFRDVRCAHSFVRRWHAEVPGVPY